MSNRFFISDTHFGHTNAWAKFKNEDGSPLRPFESTEEMDEKMVDNWNKTVGVHDTVYHLGDVVINKKFLTQISRLNGKKKLIMGNHDIFGFQKYLDAGFYDIHAYRVFVDDFVCSHIPLHPDCISDRFICNVHGHLHGNRVMKEVPALLSRDADENHEEATWAAGTQRVIDPRYFSVCVEQIDYTPISYDDLKAAIKKQMDDLGYERPAAGWGNGSGPS